MNFKNEGTYFKTFDFYQHYEKAVFVTQVFGSVAVPRKIPHLPAPVIATNGTCTESKAAADVKAAAQANELVAYDLGLPNG
jgi:hypothetical protein